MFLRNKGGIHKRMKGMKIQQRRLHHRPDCDLWPSWSLFVWGKACSSFINHIFPQWRRPELRITSNYRLDRGNRTLNESNWQIKIIIGHLWHPALVTFMVMLMREGPIFTRGNTTAYLHDESFAILLSIEYYCVDAHLRIMQATESRPSSRQRIGAVEATHDGV